MEDISKPQCSECMGKGHSHPDLMAWPKVCRTCKGTGIKPEVERLTITGVKEDWQVVESKSKLIHECGCIGECKCEEAEIDKAIGRLDAKRKSSHRGGKKPLTASSKDKENDEKVPDNIR